MISTSAATGVAEARLLEPLGAQQRGEQVDEEENSHEYRQPD
jgi:hypothetical protein